jgi:cobyrinic acid a,c-diamide synthase
MLKQDSIAGSSGTVIRGHEFHYSEITGRDQGSAVSDQPAELIYSLKDGSGDSIHDEGYVIRNTLGSYIHIHFGSNPSIANNFVHFIKEHHGTYTTGRAR